MASQTQPGALPTQARAPLRPRWFKVLSDLWGNKVRSLLVIASIAVGLFAVGLIATLHDLLASDMGGSYALRNPANLIVAAANFDEELVDEVAGTQGVGRAEGARTFDLMIRTGPDEWSRIAVKAAEFDETQINRVRQVMGAWPPGEREIVIERNKLGDVLQRPPSSAGEGRKTVEVKLPSGTVRRLPLAGVVHDQTLGSAATGGGFFLWPVQGYVTMETLEWLEQEERYNTLYVTTAEGGDDQRRLRALGNDVTEVVEDAGGLVYNVITRGAHDHPNASYTDAISGVLFQLGLLVVFLSAFLITNTLAALLNQQAVQIAIMKTVGARRNQITGVYMALIFIFGLFALLISLPLSSAAAFRLMDFLAVRINFEVLAYRYVPLATALQIGIALAVPQLAGLLPVLQGVRISVQEGLSGRSASGSDAAAAAQPVRRVKGASRPLLISLRNTFRQRGRLVLTLVTLTLGGAIFIATFNVQASMESYIRRLGRYFMADINLTLDGSYRISQVQEALREVPGVAGAEGWAYARSELLDENDRALDAVQLLAPPANSALIEPIMLEGRWIRPGDRNAIVLSERFRSRYPELRPGDTLRMRVNGEATDWVVVGFFQLAGKSAGFVAYASYDYLASRIHEVQRAPTFRVIATDPKLTLEQQRALGARIEEHLQARGFGVNEISAGASLVQNSSRGLNVLTTFLLIMAILTAVVGSIGLMGTMSMNVMDRTREIGVMRSIGASDRAVMRLVIVEGVLIGLMSWVLGVLLAIPISKLLSDTIHQAIFDALSDFTFTVTGPLAWLALVLVLSVLASVLPARNAARITIREALAYE